MKSSGTMQWKRAALTAGLVTAAALGMTTLTAGTLRAQQPDRSQYASMEHIGGEVTAVNGLTLTLKTENDKTVDIVTTTNTRVMRGRGIPAKISDLKVGDGVMAIGNLDGPGGTMHAAMVFATDASQLKAMKENLGKTYIAGKVTAIDTGNATITIERPDHVVQTVGLDETTSFRRAHARGAADAPGAGAAPVAGAAAGESITLADIVVGDRVTGPGVVKSGVFVPAQLTVLPPDSGQVGHHRGGAAAGAGPAGPA